MTSAYFIAGATIVMAVLVACANYGPKVLEFISSIF